MTATATRTANFTITEARYVVSKIKADLKLLQGAYRGLSDDDIEAYGEEAAMLLANGYLGTVKYGYRKEGNWILALRYTVHRDGTLDDDRAGRVPRGVGIDGARFHSFLTYSSAWDAISPSEREEIKKKLPLQRTPGTEPGTVGGYWTSDKTYSSNGAGVARAAFRRL